MNRKKILIVDDDAAIREVLSLQLSRLNFDTAAAADGKEAVALFSSEKPDLVIMDLLMPVMDGLAACQEIRSLEKKGTHIPIVFLTARDNRHDQISSTISGGDDFITKPISLQELRERVEAALARALAQDRHKPAP
jgi:two-component system OmpR family response regulator